MKINNYIKKSLSVLILLFVFLNTPVKTYATVFEISNIKRNIFNVSFTTNPVAINGTITVCQGQTITYTNTSTNTGTNPTYLWSFQGGNSTSETTEGPHSITYNTAGNYTTTLTINGSSSNVNVIVQNSTSTTPIIEVTTGVGWTSTNFLNEPYFNYCADGTTGGLFLFSTNSTNTNNNSQHIIDWGDGTTNTTFTGTNITDDFHAYTSNGMFQITYTVILESGCRNTQIYNVFIGANPTASIINFGVPVLCNPGTVQYSIIPGPQNTVGTIYTFLVNDNTPPQIYTHAEVTTPGFVVTHNFNTVSCGTSSNINQTVYPNSFQASITVSNPCGSSSSAIGPINIQSKPIAAITANPSNSNICINTSVTFTDSTTPGTNIGSSPTFTCTQNYKRYWQITGPSGLLTVGTNGVITPNPFVTVVGNLGFNGTFPNNPSVWSQTATNTLDITFNTAGTYSISLFTSGLNGCGITSETITICVNPEVVADFTVNPTSGCAPTTVQLDNVSSTPGCNNSNIYNWQITQTNPDNCPSATNPGWSFSSGNASTFEPEITFTSAGIYTIQLTTSLQNAVAGAMCQPDVKTITITIKDKPSTNLTTQTICEGESITLNPIVFNCYASQAVTYLWDFSSNPPSSISSTTAANPTLTFTTAGTYNYTLTLTNECGSNTYTNSIIVNPAVQIAASGPTATCINTSIPLNGSITGGTTSGTWTASIPGGTFSPSNTALSPTYTPPTNYVGTITFTLTSEDPIGPCPAKTISFQVVINEQATVDAGTYTTICQNGTIQLNGTVGGAASSGSWTSSNGGTFSDPNSLTSLYTPPLNFTGTIVLTLNTNDPPGPCNPESDTATITIIPIHTITTQPTTTQSICVGGTIAPLSVAYTGGVGTATYQWYSNTANSNTGGTLIAGATNSTYTPAAFNTAGTYYFYATVTLSGNGCGSTTSNTAEVIVVADPIVDTQAVATQTLCQNSTPTNLTITLSGGIGTFAYQWYSNTTNSTTGGTLIAGATNSSFTPPTSTVGTQYYYCVITQSGVGCNAISAISTVIIVPAPAISSQPASSSVCENGTTNTMTVTYTNGTGTPAYQWYSNTTNTNTGGTAIPGATNASYTPPSTTVGTLYYYCVITFSAGGCTNAVSNTAEVIINPLPTITTQPTTTQSICVGGTIAPLSVAYTGGVGTATYQWYSNTANSNTGGTLIAGATNSTYTPAAFNTAGTYYFYATVTLSGNGCGSTTSNTAEVIVVADPIVDTQAIATQTLCQNSTPTNLTITLSGGIGTFAYQWYSNTTNSTTGGTLIAGATNSSFTPPTSTVGTQYYYCVITQSGVGCNAISAISIVIIVPAPAISSQPASSSVCENGTTNTMTVTYTNGTGTPAYQWYSNTTNANTGGTAIPGATNASYTPPSTTVGTLYYYCVITFSAGGCTNAVSNTAEVIINPLPTITTQPTTTQSICVGGTIAPLSVAYTGGVGTATYQWYSNTANSNTGGTLIAGATNSTYTPAAFNTAGTYYFYATVTLSGNGCGSTTSNTAEVIVVADPIVDTQAIATQTLCQNSTPTNLTITLSGGIGTFAYQWYSNTTNSTTGGTLIAGATNSSFTPPTSTVGTQYYYCVITQSGVGCNAISAISIVIIVPAPAISSQPASSSVCENGTTNTMTVTYTNGTGTPAYQWYSNTTNANTGGTAIPGATNASYTPPSTTVGTLYYYCVITFSAGGCTNAVSNTAEVIINPLPTITTQPTTTQSICVGGTIAPLSVAYTGGVGTATYQWYSNTANSNTGGTLIAGATNSTYTPAAFNTAGTYYFYATVTLSGNGCGSTTSNTAEVIVVADPIVDTQAIATQTLCQNSTPTNLTITLSGGIGTFAYQWYSNTTNSTTGGTLIAGATNSSFTPPTSTVGTQYYYCVITQSGVGCNAISAISTVIIVPAPAISSQPASSSVCENGTTNTMTVTYTNGTGTPAYQWYSNTTNANTGGTAIPGATNASYTPPSTTVGTLYYYCVITFSAGGCTNAVSNTAEVIINPLPTITTQPTTTQSICVGGTIAPLSVAYTGGVGTATYQWYSNTANSNTGGTLIAGATNSTYTPAAFNTAGTYYFYATVTLSGNGCGSTTSNTAEVIVVADPIVDTQAVATQTLCQNSTPTNLTITLSGGIGTFAYQWYSNTTNSTTGGTLIAGATNSSFTPPTSTVGTQYYYCVITQSGVGCNAISAISTVIIVPAPAISSQPASSSVCENGTTNTMTVTYTNGTGTPAYQWYSNTTNANTGGTAIPGATNASYTPPSATVGTLYYYCVITFSAGGCTNAVSNTAEVIINPLPTITTQPTTTQSICVGGTIAPLSVAYTGGVGTATYQWYSNTANSNTGGTLIAGATNSTYTPAAFNTAGTYYFYATVTLSGNGCGSTTSNTAEVIVVADPIVDTQAIATQTLCQNSTPTNLTITLSGGIGTFAYQWYSNTTNSTTGGTLIAGATNSSFTPPTSTVGTQYYYCVITQSGVGCNAISAISTVIIVPAPAISSQPASSSVCENGTTNTMTVTYTNGTGTPAYQWYSNTTNTNTGGTAIPGATNASYTPPSTTVGTLYYYCVITFSAGGCTNAVSNTAEVIINQIPVVNNVSTIICSGEQYIFNSTNSNDVVPASTQYSWNLVSMTPAGAVSGSVNNGTLQNQFIQQLVNNTNTIATLVYEVTPIAGICTGNTFTITIEVYPKPTVSFDLANQTICNESNTTLVTLNSTLPGNITYNWTATIPTGITGAISNGTDIIPVQNLTNNTNTPLTITYQATATFTNNGSSCTGNVATYTITVNPTFTASGIVSNYNGYNISVFGANDGSINLTTLGGSGTYTYSWNGPNGFTSTNEDLTGLIAGTYTVTINDGYCAPLIVTFILTQPPELLIQQDLNFTINLICFGDTNGAVGALITQESVPPYDYELYDSSGNLVSSISNTTNLNPQFTGLSAGVYSLSVIDANGGVKTITGLTVTQPNDITIVPTTTPITCYGANNASITLTVSGGTAPYQAQWSNLATGFYQNNLAAGNYTILITDSNGCTKTIIVNIPEAPIFTINPAVVNISCFGANDGSINLNLVGGMQPITLTWSDGSTSGLVRNNLPPGTYTVTIVDATPCTINRTFIIVEPQPLILSANVQDALDCTNSSSGAIDLTVSGGTPPFTYNWSNGNTTEDLINLTNGSYAVVVTDSRGCTNTTQYTINRPQPLTLNVVNETVVDCGTKEINQVFTAQVSGGVPPISLVWSSGTVSGPNNEIMTTNQDGLITLTATDALGCSTSNSINVEIPVIGNASFNQNSYGFTAYGIYATLDPIQFTNTSTGDYTSLIWDFGDGTFSNEENPIHTYVQEGNYVVTLTVTYPFGCVYTQIVTLIIEKGYILVLPTAFTPNNDGLNDSYRPVTKGLKNIRCDIYDTWGSLIFSESGDVLQGWDGKIKNIPSENGNYNCKVRGETFYGKVITMEETFVLIK